MTADDLGARAVPGAEIDRRQERCRRELAASAPAAGGLLVFSRLGIYYLTGTFATGVFWLPLAGPPVLLCRRGVERARLESPMEQVAPFRSFREIAGLCAGFGAPLPAVAAAELEGLSLGLGRLLERHLPGCELVPGDAALARTRAVKSPWELERMREAGARHDECLRRLLPPLLAEGMTEYDVARRIWETFFSRGHQGLMRMQGFGEEIFLGHVSAGESGNYPSVFNGPVGLRGVHPAVPFMGSPDRRWRRGEALICDVGFGLEGYVTDKSQVFWLGGPDGILPRAQAAHDFCVEIQGWVAERLRPGAVPSRLAAHAFGRAGEAGWSDGFMARGGNRVSFVGHGIGLTIDELPVIAAGFDEPLEEGMVFALEPKIGLEGVGMVGVENTFEVTPAGGRCLTGEDYDIVCVEAS